jgi:hypothetical protein
MTICKEGMLNNIVKSVADGGVGLPEWVVAQMSEDRGYALSEITTLIQNSGLATIDFLEDYQIRKVLEWMQGKTFNGVTIGKYETQAITEEYIEGTRGIQEKVTEDSQKPIIRTKKYIARKKQSGTE